MAEQSNINPNVNQASVGLNLENIEQQLGPGVITYALNGVVHNFDGKSVTYQNEQANDHCINFPSGYKVISRVNVTQIKKVLFWLSNGNGGSQIGYTDNNSCTYHTLLTLPCLNHSLDHPILKVIVKNTNCGIEVYYTDKYNPPRFFNLDIAMANGYSNCNELLLQPNFTVPKITASSIEIGGNTKEGAYQFTAQYANILGDSYTGFYGTTNGVNIFLDGKSSTNFDEVTNKAIAIKIENLDTSGLFDFFNLAVIKTINGAATVELVGTYSIPESGVYDFVYTGTEQALANRPLSFTDVMEQKDYYDLAGDLTAVDNVLVWADLVKEDDDNYQRIWSNVKIMWEAWQVPVNFSEGFTDGTNCSELRGHPRDEVIPVEGCFIKRNGKRTPRAHVPGRIATPFDREIINNADGTINSPDICHPVKSGERWEIYNTASITGNSPGYNPNDGCYKGPYKYGEMGYWESESRYPNNTYVWGPLAGQLIRHHKLPDSTIIHIHDQNPNGASDSYTTYEHFVYPLGLKIDVQSLTAAIQNSNLTQEEKDDIVGFEIMTGNRAANKSIVAKGLLYNVGQYTKEGSTYYYPNYPFNDPGADAFISNSKIVPQSGDNAGNRLRGIGAHSLSRFTFHSPDTHFFKPSGIQGSFLKLETVEHGYAKGHFVPVANNAKYRLLNKKVPAIAFAGGITTILGIGMSFGFPSGIDMSMDIDLGNFFPTFNTVMDLVTKLIPRLNYGWNYHGVGYYGNYNAIPNNGNKQRMINHGGYIPEGVQGTFGDNHAINNKYRESSVYLSLLSGLPFPWDAGVGAPVDNSRVTASMVGRCNSSSPFFSNIASYYGSIKKYLPKQWGEIFSYEAISTGYYQNLRDENGNWVREVPTIFGGDTYINLFGLKRKHAFFNKTTVGLTDDTDIDLDEQGNVGYPIYYYSTSDILDLVDTSAIETAVAQFMNVFPAWYNLLLGGLPTIGSALNVMIKLLTSGILQALGLKKHNLECTSDSGLYHKGQAYLYSYGIPYFFAESEVNVDMRQAYNETEGNFFPRVGTDIPDDWLQETNVPIKYDNSYTYNKTYSKRNKEVRYSTIRPDFNPNVRCFTEFPNTAIWSEMSNMEETKNHWLVYRPAARHDFPKTYGKLVGIDRLQNNEVLVRFENKSQIYNALTTIQTNKFTAALGNEKLFSGQPIDIDYGVDGGSAGSQNKMIIFTEFGPVYADAKRGQVILLQGQKADNLAERGMDKWFKENLPFKVLDTFPDYPTDNHYNGMGLHGVYDPVYKRLIITKIDKQIVEADKVRTIGREFYAEEAFSDTSIATYGVLPSGRTKDEVIIVKEEPLPQEPPIFCDKSWTLSFSFVTNSWTSFHSYIPNYYVNHEDHFQSGINGAVSSLWNHNTIFTDFNRYYGTDYPYILEYPFAYKYNDEILQNVKDYTSVYKYLDRDRITEPDETIYFNKAIIGNGQQNTGILNLVPKPTNNMAAYLQYPKYHPDSKDILVTKSDSFYNYNDFWDIVKDPANPIWLPVCSFQLTDMELNEANLDYGIRSFNKPTIRGKNVKIRHILDNRHDVKLVSKFIVSPTQQSYK